jgi:gluconate 2-dehydrogenase gamma chain
MSSPITPHPAQEEPRSDRREALRILGAISVSCAFPFSAEELYGQHVHSSGLAQVELPKPSWFSGDDLKLLSMMTDLIIPATDTPSASAAGVPAYMDLVVSRNEGHQKLFAEGLAWLKEQSFVDLAEEAQYRLLEPLCLAADSGKASSMPERFFAAVKSLTADGYYTSKAGLITELGYKGNAVLPEFPTCTHEH